MDNKDKIILDLCGSTGAWSKPYKAGGYDVRVITLPDWDVTDIEDTLERLNKKEVYGILCAPPCTMFSFARTNAKKPRDLYQGMACVEGCLEIVWHYQYKVVSNYAKYTRLKFWALENPYYGLLKNFIGKPCYVFNPYDFGDGYQKKTALWGNFVEPKKSPVKLTPEMKKLAKTNSYLHRKKFDYLLNDEIHPEKLGVLDRQARRAITPAGFAKAFYEVNK